MSAVGALTARPVPRAARLRASLLCAAFGFLLAYASMSRPGLPGDFLYWRTAARALLHGQNPYHVIPAIAPERFLTPFFYPLPAAIATLPFVAFPYALGGALFVALSAGLLAFGLSRDGFYRLTVFASAPFIISATSGTWPPIIAAAALLPALGFLICVKPNVGLASLAYRPRWSMILASALFLLVSLAILPSWPLDWWHQLASVKSRTIPLLTPSGPVLLLALTRWRQREARLLLCFACIPQAPWFYDQIVLWLIPRDLTEAFGYTVVSQLMLIAWSAFTMLAWRHGAWVLVAALYLPPLVMVLRHPNTGEVPRWLDTFAARVTAARRSEPAPEPPA